MKEKIESADWRVREKSNDGEVQIEMQIGCLSVDESNLFLRLLNQKLEEIAPTGWQSFNIKMNGMFEEYKYHNNGVLLGYSSVGEQWFDYRERGCIDNYYIRVNSRMEESVKKALHEASRFREVIKKKYTICVKFYTEYKFATMCKNNIRLHSIESNDSLIKRNKDNYVTYIEYELEAYGEMDARYCAMQLIYHIKYLFCAYTNYLLPEINQISISTNICDFQEILWDNYDIGWIDGICDYPSNGDVIGIMPEFFDICNYIISGLNDKQINRIMNAARQIYVANYIMKNVEYNNQPGVADAINTIFLSSLEPLAMIADDSVDTCEKCGQRKYSISKRVNELTNKYFGPEFTKHYTKKIYGNRSKYLHEGILETDNIYLGYTWNQFDRNSKEIKKVSASVDYNLGEYVSYILRQETHEFFIKNT